MSVNNYLLAKIQELSRFGSVYTPSDHENYLTQVLEQMKRTHATILYLTKPLIVDKDIQIDMPLIVMPAIETLLNSQSPSPLLRTPIYERQYVSNAQTLDSIQAIFAQFIEDTRIARNKLNIITFQYIGQNDKELLVYNRGDKLCAYDITTDEYIGVIGAIDTEDGTITLDDTQYEIAEETICVVRADMQCTIDFLAYFDIPIEAIKSLSSQSVNTGIIDTALLIMQNGESWRRDAIAVEYFSNKWKRVTVTSITDNTVQKTINLFGDEVEINKAIEHCSDTLYFNTNKMYALTDNIRITLPSKIHLDGYGNSDSLEFVVQLAEEKPVFEIHTNYFENRVGIRLHIIDSSDVRPVVIHTTTPGVYRNIEVDTCRTFIEIYSDKVTLQNIEARVQTTFGTITGNNITLENISVYRDYQSSEADTVGLTITGASNVSVKHCYIWGFDTGILVQSSEHCTISNAEIDDVYTGIRMEYSEYITVEHVYLEIAESTNTSTSGIYISQCGGILVDDVECNAIGISIIDWGIECEYASWVSITNSLFTSSKRALRIDVAHDVFIDNCVFDTDSEDLDTDIFVLNIADNTVLQNCMIDHYSSNDAARIFKLDICFSVSIHNCSIHAHGQQLIHDQVSDYVQFSCNQVEFDGNGVDSVIGYFETSSWHITNNKFYTVGTIEGFVLFDCYDFHINGNVIANIENNEVSIQFYADLVTVTNNTTGTGNFRVNVDPNIPSTNYLVANNT